MSITAYGRFFSWEDSIYFPDWKKDAEQKYIRILGHKMPQRLGYKDPETEPEDEFTTCSGVYLLHDENREIVYVGQAKSFAARLVAHTGDHLRGRWVSYSWFATTEPTNPKTMKTVSKNDVDDNEDQHVPGELSLDMLEAVLRTAIEPKLNLQGGRWGNVPLYAQSVEYEFMYLREVFEETRKLKRQLKKLRKNE
ncbi:GIY-YIG nuclease family protein [Yoonia sp. 2307UL14-13]|uniref:GIY-YIG nuclease family protein n=1 Tax=Yoonia sp. 2307UL14-13 TaxID=3126506 RepID=UPI0030ABE0FA